MAGKLIIFHTVEYPQLEFPIRLPRSVLIGELIYNSKLFSLNESECGGGQATNENSPDSNSVTSSALGAMQFGSLWGGTNGDVLANMYTNDNSNAAEEEMDHATSEASNDSNSHLQAGLATAAASAD